MSKKRFMLVFLTIMLILPSFFMNVSANGNSTEKVDGEFASKDEVVYATLNKDGGLDDVYVVNTLDVTKPGTITDFGQYRSIKNLTDLSEIEQKDDTVLIHASKGKFFYQGDMKEGSELPWNISISYLLDGEEINPEELAGKDGHVQINIVTSANEKVDPVFYENYLLQLSLTLESDIYSNIEISDGVIANVGKNKQVNFTVMPEKDGEFTLDADVVDFEMQGVEIAALPSSMTIDAPDIDEVTEDFDSLADAIKEINNGVSEFKKGVSELNDGVVGLRNGSFEYNTGMSGLDEGSSDLVEGSESMNQALVSMSNSLSKNSDEMDLSELNELPGGLLQIANGLDEAADGLSTLRENYTVAFSSLDDAMKGIPDHSISEQDIQGLYESGADPGVVDQLVETYTAAQTAKGTYSAVREGFMAVDRTLKTISESIKEMSNALSTTANDLSTSLEGNNDLDSFAQLQEGLAALSSNYKEFHSGLVGYTNGVSQLADTYNLLHSGIVELSDGTDDLESGVIELHDGTSTLHDSTKDLPNQMQEEIDSMISEYDKSDFEPVSFVSSNNEKINSVQFVLKTESIKIEEQEITEEHVEKEEGFWDRLLALFFKK